MKESRIELVGGRLIVIGTFALLELSDDLKLSVWLPLYGQFEPALDFK